MERGYSPKHFEELQLTEIKLATLVLVPTTFDYYALTLKEINFKQFKVILTPGPTPHPPVGRFPNKTWEYPPFGIFLILILRLEEMYGDQSLWHRGKLFISAEGSSNRNQRIVKLFSSTEGRKMNTKVGLHHLPTHHHHPHQIFGALPEVLER